MRNCPIIHGFRPMSETTFHFLRKFFLVPPEFRRSGFQERMVQNLATAVAGARQDARERVYQTFNLIHEELANRVQEAAETKVSERVAFSPES